jgi:DNA invertase Pin-like site-specific DNA recombinase
VRATVFLLAKPISVSYSQEKETDVTKPKQIKHLAPEPPADRRAIAYLRTSSQTNAPGDSVPRQRAAIAAYAECAGLDVVACYADVISGSDAIDRRPGFVDALAFAKEHGVSLVLVETANRFARSLMTQELGLQLLRRDGIQLVAADSPDAFAPTDNPMAEAIRQMLGVMAQLERAMTVAKLRGARDRASAAAGKRVEGRKSYREMRPDLMRELRRLVRTSPKTGKRRSLRQISSELAQVGFLTSTGKPLPAMQIARLLSQ